MSETEIEWSLYDAQAADWPHAPDRVQAQLARLKSLIPTELQGMFFIDQVEPSLRLRVHPDAALEAFRKRAQEQGERVPLAVNVEHRRSKRVTLERGALAAFLNACEAQPISLPPRVKDWRHHFSLQPHHQSYSLAAAPEYVANDQREAVRAVIDQIPPEVRGLFCIELNERTQQLSLVMDPNLGIAPFAGYGLFSDKETARGMRWHPSVAARISLGAVHHGTDRDAIHHLSSSITTQR